MPKVKSKFAQVQKRDGRLVDFDQSKITRAIFKALTASQEGGKRIAQKLSDQVITLLKRRISQGVTPQIEEIQDAVEEVLILNDYTETAKAYILYREQRRRIREAEKAIEETTDVVDQYLKEIDWEVYENSNMAYSLQGLNNYVDTAVIKRYWLNKIYPSVIREANQNGDFHIHNLGILAPYCCGWDLYDFLIKGFSGVFGKMETKPAKHFRAALGQLVNLFYTLQGEAAGAQAVSNFDTLLAPFARYDRLSYQEVKQSMQEFLFNCNVPTRVGFQTPFENITFDIKPPANLAKQPVIIGGQPQAENYGDFQEEMNMINQAFAELMMEGDAKGRPFTFPIPTYNITKDFDWNNPSLESTFEMTAKYGIPYFANFIQGDMKPEDVRSMCLSPQEELLIRNSKKIKRISIKEIVENYKEGDFDQDGWADCRRKGNLQILSLNPRTFKIEWSSIKRFLRVFDNQMLEIVTEDGKKASFSVKHPVAVFTERGLKMKFSKDIQKGDYLISLKKGTDILSKNYQKIEDLILNKDLAKILGYLVADGNYLFENRKGYTYYGQPRGLQFTFKTGDKDNLETIRSLIKKVFNTPVKEKQDPRYNTYYLYVYNTLLARKLYRAGFKKYGRLPQILFNSPAEVIRNFLEYHFKGDGYEKRKEIHLNDLELSRDLVLLYSLIDQPVTYKIRKRSQRIYLQHAQSKIKKGNGWLNNPILAERVPAWLAQGNKVPGLFKTRMIGFDALKKYKAHSERSQQIKDSDIYITRVKAVRKKTFKKIREFFDVELAKNHLFVHSLGTVSFNCCRLRLDNKELYKRGGGLFGANPLTGCYDEKTEILTKNGWKFFKDLTKETEIFTLSSNNEIKLHRPKKLFQYDYKGEMYQFKAKSLDLLVTPNHRMVVDTIENKRKFVEAKDFIPNSHRIPKQGIWQGEEQKRFILPGIEFTKYGKQGRTPYQVVRESLKIKMDDWLKFFGFWLAEGCTDNEKIAKSHGYRIIITQANKEKKEEIKRILDVLPFNYYLEREINFVVCNKQLWTYLRQFGNKYQKFIPQEIKDLSKRQLRILFDWMVKGDGHIKKIGGQINYWTSSKKLADDLQEIILKMGWLGTLTIQKGKTSQIKGRKIRAGVVYTLGVQKAKHYRLRERNIKKIYYRGKVYCCEVENHTVFVRRNGKVTWCGNSIGVVTINLPRLGYLAKTKKEFLERLGHLMDLARDSLEIKRKALEDYTEKGLYPYSRFYLEGVKKIRNQYWGNHFSTIGLVGMNEALLNFLKADIGTLKGRRWAAEVLVFMRERLIKYQKDNGSLYNLEATPAESTSYRLAQIDKKKYPKIITAGQREPYYTNSSQLPVNYTDDLFRTLELQDDLQNKYTGGTVLHGFLGERLPDGQSVKKLIQKVFEKFHLPYFTFSPTFSICPHHGYLAGEHFRCPKCVIDQPCEVYSRIVGYLRPVQQWNLGKKEEFRQRKEFALRI